MAEGDDYMKNERMMGNIAFLSIAVGQIFRSGAELFRYRSDADYYVLGDTAFGSGVQNWWKLYNSIGMYGRMSIGVILTITQLLSMFGLFADVNVMVWDYYGHFAEPLL